MSDKNRKPEKNEKWNEKEKSRGYFKYGIIVIVLVIVAVAAVLIFTSSTNNYVAKVGDSKISVERYNFFLYSEKAYMIRQYGQDFPDEDEFWNSQIEGEKTIETAKKRALENAKNLKIQMIEADQRDLELAEAEKENVKRFIDTNIVPENVQTKSEKNKYFKEEIDMSYDAFVNVYQDIYLASSVLSREETKDVEFSEE